MVVHHEVEHTYDPPPDAVMPDFTRAKGIRAVADPVTVEPQATYFDTEDLALVRAGVSLRRRKGGDDEGWHLKVPAGDGRDELQLPLSRALRTPPKALRTAAHAWTLGRDLVPVATVTTTRTTYPLLGNDDAVLAHAVDDAVDAEVLLGERRPVAWREWEVELVDGKVDVLTAVDRLMQAEGAPLAEVSRKIVRVLGDLLEEPGPAPDPRPKKPAKEALQARLDAQVVELKMRDSEIRRGTVAGVHKTRVALRRLRAALATFRPLFDAEQTEPIRGELRWAARALGAARDADVLGEVIADVIASERKELLAGPVRRRVRVELKDGAQKAHAEAQDVLDSDRYRDLLATLDELVAEPPWTELAGSSTREVLPPRVRRDWKRLRKGVAAAEELDVGTPEHDLALHRVRKEAKRLRYASETLEPTYDKPAKGLTRHAKRLQSVLGQQHDTVVARGELSQIAAVADEAGESTFSYGRLHARLECQAAELVEEYNDAWTAAARKKHRAWLT